MGKELLCRNWSLHRIINTGPSAIIALILWVCTLGDISAAERSDTMRVTMLGTGTPVPNAERLGSAILIEVAGKRLLFDCGRGAVIRLKQAGVSPSEIDGLFLTHLHSDHVVGIPDLWLSGWFLGRDRPLRVWGPKGTRHMSEHLTQAFAFDVAIRTSTEGLSSAGAKIDARDIEQGDAYNEGSIRVSPFLVDHGSVKPAFGYRVEYEGHSVVISGDTKFSQNLIKFAEHAGCLIHAAWSPSSKNPTPPSLRSLASAEDAGRAFAIVRPKLGVIYHYKHETGLWDAVQKEYKGAFVVAKDLMVINVGRTVTWHEKI